MIPRLLLTLALCLAALATGARAHEIRPAFLQIDERAPQRYEVLWKVPARDGRMQDIRPVFDPALTLTAHPGATVVDGFALFRYSLAGARGLPGTDLRSTTPPSTRSSTSRCWSERVKACC